MAVTYIMVIQNGQFYCSFGTSLASTTIFVCANHTKTPYFDREIKYLDFVSGHLASAETQWSKMIHVNKLIQVASSPFYKCVPKKIYRSFLAYRFLRRSWNENDCLDHVLCYLTDGLGMHYWFLQ